MIATIYSNLRQKTKQKQKQKHDLPSTSKLGTMHGNPSTAEDITATGNHIVTPTSLPEATEHARSLCRRVFYDLDTHTWFKGIPHHTTHVRKNSKENKISPFLSNYC